MIVQSLNEIAAMEMVHFEDFAHLLADDMTERKMVELGWRDRAPPCVRIGHGKPRWSRDAIAYWIRNEVNLPPQRGSGRRRIKRVADDLR